MGIMLYSVLWVMRGLISLFDTLYSTRKRKCIRGWGVGKDVCWQHAWRDLSSSKCSSCMSLDRNNHDASETFSLAHSGFFYDHISKIPPPQPYSKSSVPVQEDRRIPETAF